MDVSSNQATDEQEAIQEVEDVPGEAIQEVGDAPGDEATQEDAMPGDQAAEEGVVSGEEVTQEGVSAGEATQGEGVSGEGATQIEVTSAEESTQGEVLEDNAEQAREIGPTSHDTEDRTNIEQTGVDVAAQPDQTTPGEEGLAEQQHGSSENGQSNTEDVNKQQVPMFK